MITLESERVKVTFPWKHAAAWASIIDKINRLRTWQFKDSTGRRVRSGDVGPDSVALEELHCTAEVRSRARRAALHSLEHHVCHHAHFARSRVSPDGSCCDTENTRVHEPMADRGRRVPRFGFCAIAKLQAHHREGVGLFLIQSELDFVEHDDNLLEKKAGVVHRPVRDLRTTGAQNDEVQCFPRATAAA